MTDRPEETPADPLPARTSGKDGTFAAAAEAYRAGRHEEAERLCAAWLALHPDDVGALHLRGAIALRRGRASDAVPWLRRAVDLAPRFWQARTGLGHALRLQGDHDGAVGHYEAALAVTPASSDLRRILAGSLSSAGRHADAIGHYRAVLATAPDDADTHNDLGNALQALGRLGAAVRHYEAALALRPDWPEAHSNLAGALEGQGRLVEASRQFERALALNPSLLRARSNHLMCQHYRADRSPAELLAVARTYAGAAGTPGAAPAFANGRDPERRLRLGFVSADFCGHPVGIFAEAPLLHLDRGAFELFCYANGTVQDDVTARLRSHVPHWRATAGLDDDAFAAAVRADGIDVLIDLSGHSAGNRLPALARRLAPVQMTWIGFPGTTGVAAVDYLVADAAMIPVGDEDGYGETVLRLGGPAWCYTPRPFAPAPQAPPCLAAGHVTFGSFNNPAKLTPETLTLWARLLRRVADARLLLKYRGLDDGETCARFIGLFADLGIAAGRLSLEGPADHAGLLAAYGRVDIGLDPLPFGGGATTCDALWMGVPVVTLPGRTMASRLGLSFLSAVALPELIAGGPADYVERAAALAADPARLAALRSGLRPRMAASPLCDGTGMARALGTAVREVWRRWCAARPGPA